MEERARHMQKHMQNQDVSVLNDASVSVVSA